MEMTIHDQIRQVFALEPGDWIEFKYGLDYHKAVVLNNYHRVKMIRVSLVEHLVSSAYLLPWGEIGYGQPIIYLGRGKRRWWWRWLPWRDFVKPYSRPT